MLARMRPAIDVLVALADALTAFGRLVP